MKQKVAIFATLLTFLVCIVFFLICGNVAMNRANDASLKEMVASCRLFVEATDSAAFDIDPKEAYLRKIAEYGGFIMTLYSQDGEVAFSTRAGVKALTPDEIAMASAGAVQFTRVDATTGRMLLYAVAALEDGGFVSGSRVAYSLGDSVGGARVVFVIFLLALAASTAVLIVFQISINRTNRLVQSVAQVLEEFSEGYFDSRISKVPGDSIDQVAHFNEVLGRIQDRIFKQKTHNQALNSVLNHIQNGILAVDDQLNVILISPTAKRLLGITGKPEGQSINLVSKDVKLDQPLQQAMQQEGVYTTEVAARTAAGRGHRPVRLYVSAMMKDGKAVGAIAIVEDITELRRLEQVRTDFAANVSHELKTPLTSIKGFVETLQNGAINNPEMTDKFLRIIMLEADRLTRLINDILSISKLESGNDEVALQRVPIDRFAHDIADMLSIHASEKQITLHAQITAEPIYVLGNPDRVEQMLINLIENAIKYNQPGGSVTVSVFATDNTVNISVSDTGIGIPEESIQRLFERFYRVDKGRSRSMGGTGLGLAIVKHIVRSMKGMIEVQSKLGEGTEFLITLPKAEQSDQVTEE